MRISRKAESFTESVIREMNRVAVAHGAVSLAQGFPDFACPPELKRAVAEAVDALSAATRSDAPAIVASLLDRLDADGRYALLKLALGGMRVGVSARLAKQAFAQAFEVPVDDGGPSCFGRCSAASSPKAVSIAVAPVAS